MRLDTAFNALKETPLGSQLKAEAEKRIQQQKERAKEILNNKLPIDDNKLKIILSKLDEKTIKDLMQGIKNMDAQTINKIKSGDKEAIMKIVMQNPELRALLIGRLRQELTKNPEMQKLAMKVIKGSMGGELTKEQKEKMTMEAFAPYARDTGFVKSLTANNTNRPIKDIARETEQRLKSADHYRDEYRNLPANNSYIKKQKDAYDEAMERRNERLNSNGSQTYRPFS